MEAHSTRNEWVQAAVWRNMIAGELRAARTHLSNALAGCPVSVERVQIRGTLRRLDDALRSAESGAATAARNAELVEK